MENAERYRKEYQEFIKDMDDITISYHEWLIQTHPDWNLSVNLPSRN